MDGCVESNKIKEWIHSGFNTIKNIFLKTQGNDSSLLDKNKLISLDSKKMARLKLAERLHYNKGPLGRY